MSKKNQKKKNSRENRRKQNIKLTTTARDTEILKNEIKKEVEIKTDLKTDVKIDKKTKEQNKQKTEMASISRAEIKALHLAKKQKKPKQTPIFSFFSLVFIVAFAAILTYVLFFVQPANIFTELFTNTPENLGLLKFNIFILNIIPILLPMLMLFFLTGSLAFSISLPTIIAITLSVINRYKIFLRQDPLIPSDFNLGRETIVILGNFEFSSISKGFYLVISSIIVGLLASIFVRNRKPKNIVRVTGFITTLVVSGILLTTVYSSSSLYDSFPTLANTFFPVDIYNSKGLFYSFTYDANLPNISAPIQVSDISIEDYITRLGSASNIDDVEEYVEPPNPHIFIIMSEAYDDLSNHNTVDFDGYVDPLEHFNNLAENSLSGEIFVANLGGGTADTEFDVLTGISTRGLQLKPYSYDFVTKPVDNIITLLKDEGYGSIAIHPGDDWFYNRVNVYEHLGFDESYFVEEFIEPTHRGLYVSDIDTFDMIIEKFEGFRYENPDVPLVNFTVTIENHGPYGYKYEEMEKNFNTDLEISDLAVDTFSNFFLGIHYADIELKRFTDYLNQLDEPAVMLFFGDHGPSIKDSLLFELEYPHTYENEGHLLDRTLMYHVPYIIWQNDVYKESIDFVEVAKEIELPTSDYIMNSNYLGTAFMKLLGVTNPFIDHSNATRINFPISTYYEYVSGDGTHVVYNDVESHSEEIQENVNELLRQSEWQYHILFD